ncbi:MAG: Actin- protein 6 [Chaenotheca gracillima]|nr:MAG: Actin- protein 6 [Chaenotheca gracillima]
MLFPGEPKSLRDGTIDPATVLHRRSRRTHAFRIGKPYSRAIYPAEDNEDPSARYTQLLSYHKGHLVTVEDRPAGKTLSIRNLFTSEQWEIAPSNRDDILATTVSDLIAGFITFRGRCHVTELSTRSEVAFRLPNSNLFGLQSRGKYIAVIQDRLHSGEDCSQVFLWHYDTQSSRRILLPDWDLGLGQHIIIHPKEDVLIGFDGGFDDKAQFRQTKIDFEGQTVASNSVTVETKDRISARYPRLINRPSDFDGQFGRAFYINTGSFIPYNSPTYLAGIVLSDGTSSSFTLLQSPLEITCPIVHVWKDMIITQSDRRLTQFSLNNPPESAAELIPLDLWFPERPHDHIVHFFCGDEDFFIFYDVDHLYVGCFDPEVHLEGEDETYRENMAKRARARIESNRLVAAETLSKS